MKTALIRENFLRFFVGKGHTRVESSSLVPQNDPTLLFTNAGMNQFKDVFLGFDKRPYTRATTAQKCARAGGKHNDLENVGYTTRHLTFFEMLGNFSFGDYFKNEAIHFAWEFLTSPAWLALPPEKLLVTVYADDDEAYAIWRDKIGLAPAKIIRIGDNKGGRYASDNFWQMGDTGPCGPCTEIFYDHGPQVEGGPPGSKDEDGDRFVEIWNCVFMQYNRSAEGQMDLLPKPSVDTGMGLERIAAVMQGVDSNFAIDLFQNLLKKASELTGVSFSTSNSSLNVIVDHIRTSSFLIAAGVFPGNEGRSYVLRRIIRRALRHGYKLGVTEPFFYKLVPALVREMGDAYPELRKKEKVIAESLRAEEERFSATLATGLNYLQDYLTDTQKTLAGDIAFKLYDTYGFPLDLTVEICRERGVKVDTEGFDVEMAAQKSRARQSSRFKAGTQFIYEGPATRFVGYETLEASGIIMALYDEAGRRVEELPPETLGIVVLDTTPFYAESGGQVGDTGLLEKNGEVLFEVNDCQKIQAEVSGHWGKTAKEALRLGDELTALVNEEKRGATARNHTATHLLHASLRQVLGTHVEQKGSLVAPERLRFDFTHRVPLSASELKEVERRVNAEILRDDSVQTALEPYAEAVKKGAMALFGEKYGERVRVVSVGDFSRELCGGVHVTRSGQIGLFKILSESGIASGVRRIEAVTGMASLAWAEETQALLNTAKDALKAQSAAEIAPKIRDLTAANKNLSKELTEAKGEILRAMIPALLSQAKWVGDTHLIVQELPYSAPELRKIAGDLSWSDNVVAVLYSYLDSRASITVAVSRDKAAIFPARELIQLLAETIHGKGGGKNELASAGGDKRTTAEELTAVTRSFLESKN